MEPSPFEKALMMHAFKRRRVYNFLKEHEMSLPYLGIDFTYEQLLGIYITADFSRNETTYLKDGIVEILECLNKVKDIPELTQAEAREKVVEEYKVKLSIPTLQEYAREKEEFILSRINLTIHDFIMAKEKAIEVLTQELADFKIRLGRVNIDVDIIDGKIQFKRFGEILTDMNTTTEYLIENPHPDIFVSLKAFVLFRHLHSIFKNSNKKLADYSFVYRQLVKDGLIKDSFKPEKFREWIAAEPYDIGTDAPLKTYDNCKTQQKIDIYTTLKNIR